MDLETTKIREQYPILIIALLICVISFLHYNTTTQKWQYHLVYMQAYFIPVLLAAFRYGVKGGLGTAIIISLIYFPHIMLQWGGLIENNLMRFMQIVLFNVVGYLTGLKAQGENEEKERYRRIAMELEKAIEKQREQGEKLSAMEQQLRAMDRLAIVGELTASLAHEVRNPLGSIRGAVEIIRDAVPEEIKKLEFFDILIQDTERLNRVVETYLSFSRQQSQQKDQLNLNENLQNIALMIGAQTRKNKIRVTLDLPDKALFITSNRDALWQVVMNILLNAIQVTPEGGQILIKAEETNGAIAGQQQIRLSIKDNGTGIKKEQIDEIFKPFYSTRPGGTGLGLAIVKRIVDVQKWEINVNSGPEDGTEFAILISQ